MGLSFLDKLEDVGFKALDTYVGNKAAPKQADPNRPQVVPDQTPVMGDAKLTQNNTSFIQANWKMLVGGLVAALVVINLSKK